MMNRLQQAQPMGLRWAAAGIAILSLLQYRLTILVHGPHFADLVAATRGVTIGQPHWRGYQNRVLAPYVASFVDRLSGVGLEVVVLLAMMLLPLVQNFLFFHLVRRLTGDTRTAFRYTIYFVVAYLVLLDQSWLYLWDYLDLMVFTVFLYGVLARRGDIFFIAVFVVGILNRESALYIGVWMVLDGMMDGSSGVVRPRVRSARRTALGIGMIGAGVAVVELLRSSLFVVSAAVRAGVEQVPLGPMGMTRLGHNVSTLVDGIFAPTIFMDFAVTAGVVIVPIWVLARLSRCDRTLLTIALTLLLAGAGNLIFGLVAETRVHLWLVPFVIFLHLGLSGAISRTESDPEPGPL